MIRADTFYREVDLSAEGVSQTEFLFLRIAGLRGMRRAQGGAVAWYDGAEVQKYQRIVNCHQTKPPKQKIRVSRFAKQASDSATSDVLTRPATKRKK